MEPKVKYISQTPFYRSDEGLLLGVCKGFSERFELDVLLIRIAYLFSVLFLGVSILLYFIIALCIPRKSNMYDAFQPKLFGVCHRFSRRFDMDPGLVRLFFVLLLLFTGGAVIFGYFLLYFVLPTVAEMDADQS